VISYTNNQPMSAQDTDSAKNTAMTVSVILVTIKAKDYIYSCLDSLLSQTHPPFEIMVMDNSVCSDFTPELKKRYPTVKVYSSKENLFYAKALNKGIAKACGKFILCLNDDVILDQEFIQSALEGFLVNGKVAMVSGKILRQDKKTLDSTGLFLSPWRTARERGYGQPDKGQFNKSGFIFGVSGAAAFYRKDMLEAIKKGSDYFDARFEMFYEDLDISWRANRGGWQAYYVPVALAYHLRGGSLRPDSGIDKPYARRYLNDQLHCNLIKNRYLTILKNETFFGFLAHLIPIVIYDLAVWGYVIFFRPKVIKIFFSRLCRLRQKDTLPGPAARKDFDN
jgi:GT2 family glycosyltransferase